MISFLKEWYHWIRGGKQNNDESTVQYDYQTGEDGIERHHDPYWYRNNQSTEDWLDGGEPLQQGRLHNRTDYNLPEGWGQMTPEQKDQWFLTQRVWRQINRQYDAGMWDQWDVETLRAGLSGRDVAEELQSEYEHSDD